MKRRYVVVAVLIAFVVGVAAGVAAPRVQRALALKASGRGCCLRSIGLAMQQYAGEHDNRFPTDFGVLLRERYLTPRTFVHPLSGNRVPEDFPTDLVNAHPALLRQVHDWGDYALAPGVTPDSNANWILIYERRPIYPGERGCWFNDGHVEWIPEAEFQAQMRKQWPKTCDLIQISLAMHQYAGEHDGEFPDSFGVLLKESYVMTPRVFIHPMGTSRVPDDFPTDLRGADLDDLNRVHDFGDYVLPRGIRQSDYVDTIILHEKRDFYPGERGCVFNDGHREWIPEADFQRRIAEQEAKLRELREKEGE